MKNVKSVTQAGMRKVKYLHESTTGALRQHLDHPPHCRDLKKKKIIP